MNIESRNRNVPSLSEKIGFGLGDFAVNGCFTFVSSYLLYFYTDSVNLSLESAGIILLLGRAADAISCIGAGRIVDRTNTYLGKCRPFIAICMLPMIALFCSLFAMPQISDTGKLIYGCAVYVLFSIFYAFVNVPYSTMIAVLTDKSKERVSFNLFKNVGANAGALCVTSFTMALTDYLGGEYIRAAIIYAAVFLMGLLICTVNTRERVQGKQEQEKKNVSPLRAVLRNRNWLIFIVIQFTGMVYMILHNQATVYYAKYCLEDERLSSVMLSLTPLMGVLCSFFLPALSKKVSLRNILISGHILVGISLLATLAAGHNGAGAVACAVLTSMGWSISTGMIFVMLSQLIDWTECREGVRPQGLMTSLMTFFMKMGVAVAGYIGPWILKCGGYVSGDYVSPQAIQAIKMNFIYVPAVLSFVIVILGMIYRLPETK